MIKERSTPGANPSLYKCLCGRHSTREREKKRKEKEALVDAGGEGNFEAHLSIPEIEP